MKTIKAYIILSLVMLGLVSHFDLTAITPVDSNRNTTTNFTGQIMHENEVLLTWGLENQDLTLKSFSLEKSEDGSVYESLTNDVFPVHTASHMYADLYNGVDTYYRLTGRTVDNRTIILGSIRVAGNEIHHLVTDKESISLKFVDTLFHQ